MGCKTLMCLGTKQSPMLGVKRRSAHEGDNGPDSLMYHGHQMKGKLLVQCPRSHSRQAALFPPYTQPVDARAHAKRPRPRSLEFVPSFPLYNFLECITSCSCSLLYKNTKYLLLF
jgi:hypothetical protein